MLNKKSEIIRSLKFVLFSISAGIIQILSFTVFEELLHLIHWLSYLLSLILSVLWNFSCYNSIKCSGILSARNSCPEITVQE